MYQLILLDYAMPEMDGLETCQQIREAIRHHCITDPRTLGDSDQSRSENTLMQPYICCLTAYQDPSYRNKALMAGMSNFISKPITPSQLKNLL